MLRMPPFELAEPETLEAALALLAEHGEDAVLVAGGTDLLPNLKHRLLEPRLVVSLGRVPGLRGIQRQPDGSLTIGAMTPLAEVADSAHVLQSAPALAQATGLISGPQLRTMGTLGGNVMLDTRCQWINQTHFWRKALGYCLKKDGTLCHVIEGGNRCVAAASNDSAPALMTLRAELCFAGPAGERRILIDELWRADGIQNKHVVPGEILVRVILPPTPTGHRGAYGKLRDRESIDFPLFGCAVRLDLGQDGKVVDADLCAVALVARPTRVKGVAELLVGTSPGQPDFDAALQRVAALAHRRCHPLENIPGDAAWRREMVPVYVARTFRAAVG